MSFNIPDPWKMDIVDHSRRFWIAIFMAMAHGENIGDEASSSAKNTKSLMESLGGRTYCESNRYNKIIWIDHPM